MIDRRTGRYPPAIRNGAHGVEPAQFSLFEPNFGVTQRFVRGSCYSVGRFVEAGTFLTRSSYHGCSQEIIARRFERWQEEQQVAHSRHRCPQNGRSQECRQEIFSSTRWRSKTLSHTAQELDCEAIDSHTIAHDCPEGRLDAQELSVFAKEDWCNTQGYRAKSDAPAKPA